MAHSVGVDKEAASGVRLWARWQLNRSSATGVDARATAWLRVAPLLSVHPPTRSTDLTRAELHPGARCAGTSCGRTAATTGRTVSTRESSMHARKMNATDARSATGRLAAQRSESVWHAVEAEAREENTED
eukprot:2729618-Rhodomonas_salina.7